MAEVDDTMDVQQSPRAARATMLSNARRSSSFYDKSQASHRWFPSVREYVEELGGDKSLVVEKVLIANNGVAAVKAIRSIRKWAYEVFRDERAIKFVVMATPEDLRANAEYIRMGDVIIDVPGGSNNHNYANVTLIVELARLHGVQAVWAGWGHASENPLLPDTLAKSTPPIKFIGPSGPPMKALGDKIGSTIIAQSAGVSCIAWNGDDVKADYDKERGELPESAYDEASIHNATQASEAAAKIGLPVMIKASEGGGGKGIRKVERIEDVPNAYRQVCGEVPGSPIFIMKLSSNSRHLEVQLLADEYGNAVALNGRDCSVQRRHQKIIEEGPPIAASPEVWTKMEEAAVALAKAVGYANAGTVEYLYNEQTQEFFFLELNPRLQVEHPVTEMITKVNLPAAQLQVAMGIPLDKIPEIRTLYGRNRFEDDSIDFATTPRLPPAGHCIAVRITAENAEAGFKPTSGGIQELNFRSTPNVWGYFSMDSSGSIHEFADSQFGHLFASGVDREQARRNMVLALKELSIRGDISTTVDYISRLIELEDFIDNHIDTAWLDGIIQENAMLLEGGDGANAGMTSRGSLTDMADANTHLHVVIGAIIVAFNSCIADEKTFLDLLGKGQLPPRTLLKMTHPVELILNGVKYILKCTRKSKSSFKVELNCENDALAKGFVMCSVRTLSDGGYLIEIGGQSHVAYLTSKGDAASGMRMNVAGSTVAFSPDYDPTSLRTDVAGKLVKRLVPSGSHVKKGEPYAEIEVMKMFMPLKVEEAGVVEWKANEGAALAAGDLLATLELDNPENVSMISTFEGSLNVQGWGSSSLTASTDRPHLLLRSAMDTLNSVMAGDAELVKEEVDAAMSNLARAVTDPLLPVLEVDEQLSVLAGRISNDLFDAISALLQSVRVSGGGGAGQSVSRFPAEECIRLIDDHMTSLSDPSLKSSFASLTSSLKTTLKYYTRSRASSVQGAEKVLSSFIDILRRWISIERCFCDSPSYADSIESIRKTYKEDPVTVFGICRAHEQLQTTCYVVQSIMRVIDDGSRVDPSTVNTTAIATRVSMVVGAESLPDALPAISEIGSMGYSPNYAAVALQARKLLLQESMPSLEQRKDRVLEAARKLSASDTREADDLLADQTPVLDVFFPLLKKGLTESEEVGLLELYARRLYRTYTIKDTLKDQDLRSVTFSFSNKASERVLHKMTSVSSMTELTSAVSSSNLSKISDSTEGDPNGHVVMTDNPNKIPSTVQRTGVCKILDNIESLEDSSLIESVLKNFPEGSGGAINVLYLIVAGTDVSSDEQSINQLAETCQAKLVNYKGFFEKAQVRRVTVSFSRKVEDGFENTSPVTFTYRSPTFGEDSLIRCIDPSHAIHLDLGRVAANFTVSSLGARHTSTSNIHLYQAAPRAAALAKDPKANKAPRIFARALSFSLDFSSSSFERILVDALNALDLCSDNEKGDNHLFINLVSDFEKVVLDPVVVEQVVVDILKRHNERILSLGIVEVETKILCCLSRDSLPISLRLVASNPTGYVNVMNTYVEAVEDASNERFFKLIGGTKASLAGAGDSSWEGLNVNTPYPLTRPFDHQRRAALKSSDTLYCYDLPALFEAAIEQEWINTANTGAVQGSKRPLMVMYTTELVVKNANSLDPDRWSIQDYLSGNLELVQVNRGAGANNVGMVAWLMELRTVEYPNGRQVVLIANDITHKAGSFGTREDVVFKMASEFAREKRIPRLYVAANSGARIGLSDSVKKMFKVAFKDPSLPENGFDFIYVTEEDYNTLTAGQPRIRAEPSTYQGQKVYKVTDIIGSEPDLGVENLKGSGLIAGETSAAYNDIFTMTIVLGRTVGIGAYLVRLGQRCIQKTTASPIILTGYQALNKLMGVDVYSTNDQLGGPGIMYSNGVSHLAEPDHLGAVKAAINWLAYVPSKRGGLLPITDIRGVDHVERPIDFSPTPGTPYDPRFLLAGCEDDSGNWLSGFFDKGSFKETLAGWAKTVVVGRARLGGIPMGVVITENRTAENIKPADPADVKASEAVIQEAGCVWFPNSAYKTAQAINDFRTEDLPLIVFANWRGFSGGQRDMFDEVLKYGSLIVDAFVAYEQPVFVFIPPFGEIRGGAWVVLDASINASVMEMYASSETARGGVLEANGAASVKYRTKDLLATMHRLDEKLISLKNSLTNDSLSDAEKTGISNAISARERSLLPVYEQISVQFCELHDTPGRMEAVGVIRKQVEWRSSRAFFYWRLRRKLAEFDLRKKVIDAAEVGRGVKSPTPLEATDLIKQWFLEAPGMNDVLWEDDKVMLSWMGANHAHLEAKVVAFTKECVVQEVVQVMCSGGNTGKVGTQGIVEGITQAMKSMTPEDKEAFKAMIANAMEE